MSKPTIRDGLWFAALMLVALGWLIDHENLSRDNSKQLEAAKAAWAAAAQKDADELHEKIDYILRRMGEKFPSDTEPVE